MMLDHVVITEVGPRDGLQNESIVVPLADKVRLVEELAAAGCPEVEVSAFVRPDRVPQLADAEEVFSALSKQSGTMYSALVPNLQGFDRACAAGAEKVSLFTAASDTFSMRNTNTSVAGTIERFSPVVKAATLRGIPVRVYVSCVVACPFEGRISPEQVASVVQQVVALGDVEVDLGDTIGAAKPSDIDPLVLAMRPFVDVDHMVLHLHDTHGGAVECARRAIELGVRRFDASCGGLGGCPFAPGAPGNVATGDMVTLCHEMGYDTGIDPAQLAATSRWIRNLLCCRNTD
jgi:hydroxymethylglutaryl-CoA lyase